MLISAILALTLAATNPGPAEVVRQGNDELQKILSSKDVTVERLANKADEFVDFVELARRALDKEWDKLSPKQREEFSTTMKELLRASYAQKAIGQGQTKIAYGKAAVKENEAEVPTKLTVGKDDFPVVYRLYRLDEQSPWRIFDVVTDEVSLMETYRDQFRQIIASKGYDGLLQTLQKKRDQLTAKSATTGK